MAHILAFHQIDHLFADIAGMVADALQGAQGPDDVEHPGNGPRIFHHEGDQRAHGAAVFQIHFFIFGGHGQRFLGIEAGKGIQGIAQHVAHMVTDVTHLNITAGRFAFFRQL